ncbi:MAG: hypothetical protein MJ252_03615 [archaeon]|nr:hypothetical protein [archaeon]
MDKGESSIESKSESKSASDYYSKGESKSVSSFGAFSDSSDGTEAILINEPSENTYSIISPEDSCKYPYFLLGLVRLHFFSEGKSKVNEGVGMLIGLDLVLTAAHNIYLSEEEKLINLEFIPFTNGIINIFKSVNVYKSETPTAFNYLKSIGSEETLQFDYGLCFLSSLLGLEIIKFFNLEKDDKFTIVNERFFKFFIEQWNYVEDIFQHFDSGKLNEKISLVSYIQAKEESLKSEYFRYRNCIQRLINQNDGKNKDNSFIIEDKNTVNRKIKNKFQFFDENHPYIISECKGKLMNINMKMEKKAQKESKEQKDINNIFSFSDKNSSVTNMDRSSLNNFNNQIQQIKDKETFDNSLSYRESTSTDRTSKCSNINNISLTYYSNIKNYEMNYVITTYIGQSGSPLFYRVKNKSIGNQINKKENEYNYYLIGIHTSCPKKCYKLIDAKNYIDNSGFSLYNIGLYINQAINKDIIDMCRNYPLKERNYEKVEFNFLYLHSYFAGEPIFNGIFPKDYLLSKIFDLLSEKYFNFPKEFIRLNFRNKYIDYPFSEEEITIQSFIYSIYSSDKNEEFHIIINVEFNYDGYCDKTTKILAEQIKEKYNLEEEELSRRKEIIVSTVYYELKMIHKKNIYLYGILYNQILGKLLEEFKEYFKEKE